MPKAFTDARFAVLQKACLWRWVHRFRLKLPQDTSWQVTSEDGHDGLHANVRKELPRSGGPEQRCALGAETLTHLLCHNMAPSAVLGLSEPDTTPGMTLQQHSFETTDMAYGVQSLQSFADVAVP